MDSGSVGGTGGQRECVRNRWTAGVWEGQVDSGSVGRAGGQRGCKRNRWTVGV